MTKGTPRGKGKPVASATKFGEVLVVLRRARKMSATAVANAVGIKYSYLTGMERGWCPPPANMGLIRRILEQLGEPDRLPEMVALAIEARRTGGSRKREAKFGNLDNHPEIREQIQAITKDMDPSDALVSCLIVTAETACRAHGLEPEKALLLADKLRKEINKFAGIRMRRPV